jgi:hypothetical protein
MADQAREKPEVGWEKDVSNLHELRRLAAAGFNEDALGMN